MIDYSSLNEAQLDAVTTTEGYIRVIASAGSGKTRALAYRYAYLVDELGVSPENIVCVTFTNKAANEMKERIRSMLGDTDTTYVNTFHGIGVKILHEELQTIGWPSSFRVMDDDDINTLLRRICDKLGCASMPNPMELKNYIAKRKTSNNIDEKPYQYVESLIGKPAALMKSRNGFVSNEEIYHAYLNEQKKGAYIDYNDMICIPLYLFSEYPEIQHKWSKVFEYVMVDEFQDVSGGNYSFCEAISSFHKNLFVVGDPDQLIYSWRGATMDYIMQFDRIHSDAKTILMNTNYRSSGAIIGVANQLIAHNTNRIEKDMATYRTLFEKVKYCHTIQPSDASRYVASEITALHSNGVPYHDIAILYRAHYISGTYEKELIQSQIPYTIYSGTPFYQRKEVKDMMAFLGLVNHENILDFTRALNAPHRRLSADQIDSIIAEAESTGNSLLKCLEKKHPDYKTKQFIEMIEKYGKCKEHLYVSDLLGNLFTESGLEQEYRSNPDDERLDNILALKNQIIDMETEKQGKLSLQEYLDAAGAFTGIDKRGTKESVSLMTVHGAKGLEFPYVFCVGMNEGIFPSYKIKEADALEEERRIAYVAFTRAMNQLWIIEAERSGYDGEIAQPSRFIFDAGVEQMDIIKQAQTKPIQQAQIYTPTPKYKSKTHSSRSTSSGNRYDIESDYQVHSKIANAQSFDMLEGYPVIKRSLYDKDYLNPDESEYSYGSIEDFDENAHTSNEMDSYSIQNKKKYPQGYDG